MLVSELEVELPVRLESPNTVPEIGTAVRTLLPAGFQPIRFVIVEGSQDRWRCEIGGISSQGSSTTYPLDDIFRFNRRPVVRDNSFNAVVLVPTGIGAEVGGHAGDACPALRMISAICDNVVTHPNVVNASDINEMPENGHYVEGSVICRLLMGTAGLQPVRSNRVLVVIDAHQNQTLLNASVNTVGGARASYGLQCPEIVCLDPPVKLRARFANSGRAAGRVEEIEGLCRLLTERRNEYDAVAISSVIDVPEEFHLGYFSAHGGMVNPWGGVEAILTHALSSIFNVPTAHSPMFETCEVAELDPGIVDPRMGAEAVSFTFLQCILKGLQKSPRIITDSDAMNRPGIFTAEDVSCLVIPDGCLGLPTLAALYQGIPVIAVRENANLMRNELTMLPWSAGQFYLVDNYWEAAGVLSSLKAGIDPHSVRRPLAETRVTRFETNSTNDTRVANANPVQQSQ
jgi:hypothetical protein